jgi:hypothetical protein
MRQKHSMSVERGKITVVQQNHHHHNDRNSDHYVLNAAATALQAGYPAGCALS